MESQIRRALLRLGINDVVEWGESNCTTSLADLNARLDTGVAPIHLQKFMAERAKESGRYDRFVRTEAVRTLNQSNALTIGGPMWMGPIETASQEDGYRVWERLAETKRSNPSWRPQRLDDPLIAAAFENISFGPTESQRRFDEVLAFMHGVAARNNQPWSHERAAHNFRDVAAGYGLLYGMLTVENDVPNGGFIQFYENTGGAAVQLAINGLQTIGREDLARVVEESLQAAAQECPEALSASAKAAITQHAARCRTLEELDAAYYELAEPPGWFDLACLELIASRPNLFAQDA